MQQMIDFLKMSQKCLYDIIFILIYKTVIYSIKTNTEQSLNVRRIVMSFLMMADLYLKHFVDLSFRAA